MNLWYLPCLCEHCGQNHSSTGTRVSAGVRQSKW